jgi:hypothetical protein
MCLAQHALGANKKRTSEKARLIFTPQAGLNQQEIFRGLN